MGWAKYRLSIKYFFLDNYNYCVYLNNNFNLRFSLLITPQKYPRVSCGGVDAFTGFIISLCRGCPVIKKVVFIPLLFYFKLVQLFEVSYLVKKAYIGEMIRLLDKDLKGFWSISMDVLALCDNLHGWTDKQKLRSACLIPTNMESYTQTISKYSGIDH